MDGAYGSFIILDPHRRHLVQGIDQADSLVFDFHKWLHCPFTVGCVLVHDKTQLRSTFSTHKSYLDVTERISDGDFVFSDYGPEISRPCRALKVWFTLKEHGTIKLGQKIADNCDQAKYLVSLLEKHEHIIRILRPSSLNVINFRFEPEAFDKTDHELIDMFNRELAKDVLTSGIAIVSPWRIQNRLYIRVAILSHRSVHADVDVFMETLLNLYQIRIQTFLTEKEQT